MVIFRLKIPIYTIFITIIVYHSNSYNKTDTNSNNKIDANSNNKTDAINLLIKNLFLVHYGILVWRVTVKRSDRFRLLLARKTKESICGDILQVTINSCNSLSFPTEIFYPECYAAL